MQQVGRLYMDFTRFSRQISTSSSKLLEYHRAKFDNLPAEFLAQLKREVENG